MADSRGGADRNGTSAGTATKPETVRLSVCLFCGSSDAADPEFLDAAAALGRCFAAEGVRLVYGGGGIGLMGRAAKAAHAAGGEVLGVMPEFLRRKEVLYDEVETVVVRNMHERKRIMFEQSDAFAVAPGGIGTLEEVVELMSWRRLELHAKPIVFVNLKGFWAPLFAAIEHGIAARMTPPWLPSTFDIVGGPEEVLPAIRARLAGNRGAARPGEVAVKA